MFRCQLSMSGSCVEMKLPSSAVLFLILWKFILMILRGLWACLSAVVVSGEASLLLVGDVGLLLSSEENLLFTSANEKAGQSGRKSGPRVSMFFHRQGRGLHRLDSIESVMSDSVIFFRCTHLVRDNFRSIFN